ncbi:unnamed protein product [Hymenolepis diminuta]|uniref:Uncharacterized protein n=1 Tax=Hymenolepis diminuta TaxID=6216 RepID=A0A564Y5H5_HYMDI|nr:unnamed protein product [Hymenolepis diminuta]
MLHKQREILSKLLKQFANNRNLNTGQSEYCIPKLCLKNVVLQIGELHHDPEAEFTNNNLFDKCKNVFIKDLADIRTEKESDFTFVNWGPRSTRSQNLYLSKEIE